jgi:hypothetical protein
MLAVPMFTSADTCSHASPLLNRTGFSIPELGRPKYADLSAKKTDELDYISQPIGQKRADKIAKALNFDKKNSLTNQQYLELVLGGESGNQDDAVYFGQSVSLFINNIGFPLYSTV